MKGNSLKIRKVSLKVKIIVPIVLFVFILSTLICSICYFKMKGNLIEYGKTQAVTLAKLTAGSIDGDTITSIHPGDEDTEIYLTAQAIMQKLNEQAKLKYLFTIYKDTDGIYKYGVDIDDDPETYCAIGSEFEDDPDLIDSIFISKEAIAADEIAIDDYGTLIDTYAPIFNSNGDVVAIVGCNYDATGIVKDCNSLMYTCIALCIGSVVFIIVFLTLFLNRIFRGIYRLSECLFDLVNSKGDLTKHIDLHSGDEVEMIAEQTNALLDYIRELMINIDTNSKSLLESARGLDSNVGNVEGNIGNLASISEEMSATMEETSSMVSRIDEMVEQMFTNLEKMQTDTSEGFKYAQGFKSKSEVLSKEAAAEQSAAEAKAQTAASSMQKCIEESKNVEKIKDLTQDIISISSQTNLLSLNASIEAARAGEAGRGFSVVAAEIAKLADASSKVAKEINSISELVITSVETLSGKAQGMTDLMQNDMLKGYERLVQTGQEYSTDSEKIDSIMHSCYDKVTIIKDDAGIIKSSIENINEAAEDNANGAVSLASMANELETDIKNVADTSQKNNNIADTLKLEVSKFKLYN